MEMTKVKATIMVVGFIFGDTFEALEKDVSETVDMIFADIRIFI